MYLLQWSLNLGLSALAVLTVLGYIHTQSPTLPPLLGDTDIIQLLTGLGSGQKNVLE